jgi:hypothetical protein
MACFSPWLLLSRPARESGVAARREAGLARTRSSRAGQDICFQFKLKPLIEAVLMTI